MLFAHVFRVLCLFCSCFLLLMLSCLSFSECETLSRKEIIIVVPGTGSIPATVAALLVMLLSSTMAPMSGAAASNFPKNLSARPSQLLL